MTIDLNEIKDHVGHKIVCTMYEKDHNYVIECETCHMVLFEWDSELYGELPLLTQDEVNGKVQDPDEDRYLTWVGFIELENERGRQIGYYGKFCKTKKGVLGVFKLLLNNTVPYKLLMVDTKPLRQGGDELLGILNEESFFAFEVTEKDSWENANAKESTTNLLSTDEDNKHSFPREKNGEKRNDDR